MTYDPEMLSEEVLENFQRMSQNIQKAIWLDGQKIDYTITTTWEIAFFEPLDEVIFKLRWGQAS